jgi:type I restriction enzyme, S subunit
MNKNNENKLVPKLRFPEFKNDGEWNEKIVSQLVLYENGKAHEQDITDNGNFVVVNSKYISSDGEVKKYSNTAFCLAKKDDVLMVLSDVPNGKAIAKCFLVDKDNFYTVNQRICKLTSKDVNGKILFYLLNRNPFFLAFDDGVKQTNLKNDDVLNCPIVIAKNPKEQQKIANCLSSIDEVITAESQKLEVLKEHKKGLLQNLFPQEGETVPNLRFSQYEENGDWKETTLTQVADYENGKAHEQDIDESGEYIVVNSKFISTEGEVKKYTNTAFCPTRKGDILMVLSDVPKGKAIAKCFLVEEDNRYSVNQRICRITPRNLNSKILFYLLNRNPYFLSFDDGVKQINLRKEDVLKCPLLISSDPKEQEKIAETLSSIDDLINAQSQKIEALKLHKKGLLQGLFPDVNTISE